jgi:hypothetical protein
LLRDLHLRGGFARRRSVNAIRAGVAVLERGGPLAVSTRELPEGVAVLVDGNFVFRVLDTDVNPESGETTKGVADMAVRNLTQALGEIRESRDSRAMGSAVGYSLLATAVLVGLLWLLTRGYARLARRVRNLVQRRAARLAPGWASHVVSTAGLENLATVPLRLAAWVIALLLMYEWAGLVLGLFRTPLGRETVATCFGALGDFGAEILKQCLTCVLRR